eukprot:164762-Hanusia_phi.AAC.1
MGVRGTLKEISEHNCTMKTEMLLESIAAYIAIKEDKSRKGMKKMRRGRGGGAARGERKEEEG